MKKSVLFALAPVLLVACQPKVELVQSPSYSYKLSLSSDADTRLTVAETPAGLSAVWQDADALGVFIDGSQDGVNLYGEVSTSEGVSLGFESSFELTSSDCIMVYSPYSEDNDSAAPESITLEIPEFQMYNVDIEVDGDSGEDVPGEAYFCYEAAPQVSTPQTWAQVNADKVRMINLASMVRYCIYSTDSALQQEKVMTVTYCAPDISGPFEFDLTSIDATNESTLAIAPQRDSITTFAPEEVPVLVGSSKQDGGVVYMAVAPGSRTGEIVVTTDVANYTFELSNPLVLTRSQTKKVNLNLANAARELAEDFILLEELANCYVVDKAAEYAICGTVMGNGDDGILEGARFHTVSAQIQTASASLVWEDVSGFIEGVWFDEDDELIHFVTGGNVGNAVIAAMDSADKVLWSWHIWGNGGQAIEDEQYTNLTGDTFLVMDRALGAHSKTSEVATLYQWGRKDPFPSATTYYVDGAAVDIRSSFPVYVPTPFDRFAPRRAAASYTASLITASDINSMQTNTSKTVMLVSPNKEYGYVLGFDDGVTGEGGPFVDYESVKSCVDELVSNTTYHFTLARNADRSFTISSVNGDLSPTVGTLLTSGASIIWDESGVDFECLSVLDFSAIDNKDVQLISDYEAHGSDMVLFKTKGNTSYYLHASTSASGFRFGTTSRIVPRNLWLVFEVAEGAGSSEPVGVDARLTKSVAVPGQLMPATTVSAYGNSLTNNWLTDNNTLLWGDRGTGASSSWTHGKSIYDPCPAGYRVANKYTWTSQRGQGYTKPGRRYVANSGSLYIESAANALYTPGNESSYLSSAPGESDASLPGYASSLYLEYHAAAKPSYLREPRVNANAVRCVRAE